MVTRALIAAFLIASAGAQEISKEAILKTVEHMQALNHDLQTKLDEEQTAHAAAQQSLEFFQTQVDSVTAQANEQAARADKAENALDAANAKLKVEAKHVTKLKTICCSAGAAIALLLLIMVGLPKFGIYGIAGTALIAGGVYTGLWFIL
jgi:peptidoglycan hydrolase CwlO-like protein